MQPDLGDSRDPGAIWIRRRCEGIARASSVFAIGIGLAVLIGWSLDLRLLMTVLPGCVAMKPNTAVAFCASGLSLFLFLRSVAAAPSPHARRYSLVLAGAVALLGALTLGEYLSGFNLGIDELLFADYVSGSAGYVAGRMSPISAANFVALGLALAVLHFPAKRRWAQALTGLVALTALLADRRLCFWRRAALPVGQFHRCRAPHRSRFSHALPRRLERDE